MTGAAQVEHLCEGSDAGVRVDALVADLCAVSRSRASALVAGGHVRLDGSVVTTRSVRVEAGQQLVVDLPAAVPVVHEVPPAPPIRWEDEHLAVVAKPAGLVVHPGAGTPTGTLVQALDGAGVPLAPAGGPGRPGIVHRLDRDTSGLLVVAKTDEAHAGLVSALQRRAVERRYLAVVEGVLPAVSGRVDAPIGRDPRERTRFACVEDGKPAVTHWEVRAESEVPPTTVVPLHGGVARVSLLVCALETGRTHQIRVHLSAVGHPVLADRTYGARRDLPEALGLTRFFLHAAALGFDHPVTGERVEVSEPLPEDLAGAAAVLGLSEAAGVAVPAVRAERGPAAGADGDG
ncbi:MAG: RluA family pseudouridine synthase [Actinomycetes bacterium]